MLAASADWWVIGEKWSRDRDAANIFTRFDNLSVYHRTQLMADLHLDTDLLPLSTDAPSLPLRVITPHAGLDAFRIAARSLWTGLRQARQLAWRFFLRDTRADHRQSLLGYVWLLFPPLANTLVWVFLNGQNVIEIDSGGAG